jgi:3-hydroxymyristoyl/3-hydroxydecanoyl-(acyl carrier protein) dehydratase
MLAFFAEKSDLPHSQSAKKAVDFVAPQLDIPIFKDPELKSPAMYAVDALRYEDPTHQEALFSYTFPDTHPLVKGHFPDQPVMMGVMQWLSIEDSIRFLATRWSSVWGQNGLIKGSADLVKTDGTSVCEVKNFGVSLLWRPDGTPYVDTVSTDKISFRDAVSPNEPLFIHLKSLTFEATL